MDIRNINGEDKASRMNSEREDADSFWDIAELMPRRRMHGTPAPRRQTEAVEVKFASRDESAATDTETVKIPTHGSTDAGRNFHGITEQGVPQKQEDNKLIELIYEPQGGLLHRVTVMRWQTGYSYYEQFLRNAKRFENSAAPPSSHVPFFSYMPQYSQLDSTQLAFYIFWRGEIRSGRAPSADYSYILLYIYELINLYSGTSHSEMALERLCFLWRSYREEYPRLDIQLADWVRDFCLVNRLPAPLEKLDGIPVADCADRDLLREFYIAGSDNEIETALISYCSNYDWHRSKYAVGDVLPLYRKHMAAAGRAAIRALGCENGILPGMRDCCVTRDAYVGALCAPCAKRRMKIEYCSFTRSHEVRALITDILKYSENKLRAALGIKSRLSCRAFPSEARKAVDEYFAKEFPPAAIHRQSKAEPPPEYERLYEPLPENNTLSIENAARIEAESWGTTDRLLDAFADDDTLPTAAFATDITNAENIVADFDDIVEIEAVSNTECDIDANGNTEIAENSELALALGELCEFVFYAADGDIASERRMASRCGTVADAMADRVNELAAENFGDIILEERNGAWCVILDYLDEVREALSLYKKG